MKPTRKTYIAPIAAALLAGAAFAASDVDPANKFSWQENTGWMNWRDADGTDAGVRVEDDHLAGYIWAENIGFINVGDGGGPYPPTLDQTGESFGVNLRPSDGLLSGYAWAENVGWINFDTAAAIGPDLAARFDASARRFRGFAWSENLGWINLDDQTAFVGTIIDTPCPGDTNEDDTVDFNDLLTVLDNFGNAVPGGGGDGDFDNSGTTDFNDLLTLLDNFGNTCP